MKTKQVCALLAAIVLTGAVSVPYVSAEDAEETTAETVEVTETEETEESTEDTAENSETEESYEESTEETDETSETEESYEESSEDTDETSETAESSEESTETASESSETTETVPESSEPEESSAETADYIERTDPLFYVKYRIFSDHAEVIKSPDAIPRNNGSESLAVYSTVTNDTTGEKVPVTAIAEEAFAGNRNVKRFVIPENVKTIGKKAFAVSALQLIELPGTLESVGEGAFQQCQGLTEITVPGNVKTLGPGAFAMCSNLETVILEDGVETIEGLCFDHCKKLNYISIPASASIADDDSTICNGYDNASGHDVYHGTIAGYTGSNAEAYAQKYNIKFLALGQQENQETQAQENQQEETQAQNQTTAPARSTSPSVSANVTSAAASPKTGDRTSALAGAGIFSGLTALLFARKRR